MLAIKFPLESVEYFPAGMNQLKTAMIMMIINKIVKADGILKRCCFFSGCACIIATSFIHEYAYMSNYTQTKEGNQAPQNPPYRRMRGR